MFRLLTIIIACSFSVRLEGADRLSPVSGKGPHFVIVGGGTNELGKIANYEKKIVLFCMKNEGGYPGEIHALVPTCSCISGTVSNKRIGPQEAADIRVVLDASTVHQGAFRRLLWVETNDPESPRIPIVLRGEVLPLVHGLPASPRQRSH